MDRGLLNDSLPRKRIQRSNQVMIIPIVKFDKYGYPQDCGKSQ